MKLSAGKRWGMRRMADANGLFKMTAVDQRPPIKNHIKDKLGLAEAPWSQVAERHTAVIGAIGNDDNGLQSGSAYVFARTSGVWTEQAKLLPSDGAAKDYFGGDVAIDGDTAVIGASWNDDNGAESDRKAHV